MNESSRAADTGLALLDLGRAAEAETHFRRALAAEPASAELLVLLARSVNDQSRHAEAVTLAQQALSHDPRNVVGLLVLSAALAGTKSFDDALAAVRRGQQIAPDWSAWYRQEGALLLNQDRAAEAFGPLEHARRLDPEDADIVALLGAAHFQARQFPQAEQAAADALRLDPDNIEAHRLRGLLELRRGGGRAAVDAHRTALRLDPTNAYSREALSVAMKSRNPVYGLLLRWGSWIEGLPAGARWGLLLLPALLSRALRPFEDETWALVLLILVVAFVALTWALEPVMNVVLLCSSYSRNLLPPTIRRATHAFLAYATAAVAAVVTGVTTGEDMWLLLAFGLTLWAVTAGQVHLVDESRQRLAIAIHCVGAALAVVSVVVTAFGLSAGVPALGALVVGGVLMIWFTILA